MAASSLAAVYERGGAPLRLERFETPAPGPGEALVRVRTCTLCASDLATLAGRRSAPAPSVLGHETVGEIAALGPGGVRADDGAPLLVGERVVWAVTTACGSCEACARAWPQKCAARFKYGHEALDSGSPLSGGLAEHVLLRPHSAIARVPDALDDRVAAQAALNQADLGNTPAGDLLRATRALAAGEREAAYSALAHNVAHQAALLPALNALERAPSADEGALDAELNLSELSEAAYGLVELSLGRALPALERFEALRQAAPNSVLGHLGTGRAALVVGRHARAEEALTTSASLLPNDPLPLLWRVHVVHALAREATGAYRNRLLADAKALVLEATRGAHSKAITHLACAVVDELEDPERLAAGHGPGECVERALDSQSGEGADERLPAAVVNELAALLLLEAAPELATETAREALAQGSGSGLPEVVLAHVALRHGDREQAMAQFSAAFEKAPESALALEGLLELQEFFSSGDRIDLARRALRLRPDRPDLNLSAGGVLREAGELQEARAAYEYAAERYEALGLLDEARDARRMAEELGDG